MKAVKKNMITTTVAKSMVHALNAVLHHDANSTSCIFIFQPKQPAELSRFRKIKDDICKKINYILVNTTGCHKRK